MKTSKINIKIWSFLLALVFIVVACDDDDPSTPGSESQTITEIAASNDDFTILTSALIKADLDGVLDGSGSFTVFAPTDDAFEQAGITNLDNLSAEDFLKLNRNYFDLLFLDPSRRDADKRRLYAIEDYEPNLIAILPQLLEIADRVYVKLSPMISIAEYQKQLEHLSEVWLISERNECKEVGFLFQKLGKEKALKVNTWDIYPESVQQFSAELPSLGKCPLGELQAFIYLPNSSILKAGIQDQCANQFQLLKLDSNTNLYSSDKLLETFPGRKFKLLASHKPYASALKKKKLQVISRNFPDSPEKIQQKLKLNPKGAKDFLIATSLHGQAIFLECEWIFNSTISNGG